MSETSKPVSGYFDPDGNYWGSYWMETGAMSVRETPVASVEFAGPTESPEERIRVLEAQVEGLRQWVEAMERDVRDLTEAVFEDDEDDDSDEGEMELSL